MVTACCDHVARWAIRWASYHFTNKVCLPCSDHVSDARDRVENFTYFVVVYSFVLVLLSGRFGGCVGCLGVKPLRFYQVVIVGGTRSLLPIEVGSLGWLEREDTFV